MTAVVVLGDGTDRMKATGNTIEFRFAHVFTVRNGKVVSLDDYTDMSAVVSDLRSAHSHV